MCRRIFSQISEFIREGNPKFKNGISIFESKNNNLNDEYTKDKSELKQIVNNYNDMIIESKLRIKTYEEKIKIFENEKRTLKERRKDN